MAFKKRKDPNGGQVFITTINKVMTKKQKAEAELMIRMIKYKEVMKQKAQMEKEGIGVYTPSNIKEYFTNPMGFYQSEGFDDITHADGSKDYANVNGGHITIKRPSVVKFVDNILTNGFMGYGYMETLRKALSEGIITDNEHSLIINILD
jgi:hypothetical protein